MKSVVSVLEREANNRVSAGVVVKVRARLSRPISRKSPDNGLSAQPSLMESSAPSCLTLSEGLSVSPEQQAWTTFRADSKPCLGTHSTCPFNGQCCTGLLEMLIGRTSLPRAALQKTITDLITEQPIWGPRSLCHLRTCGVPSLLGKLNMHRSSCDKLSLG